MTKTNTRFKSWASALLAAGLLGGGATGQDAETAKLARVVSILQKFDNDELRFELAGYADPRGNAAYNRALSLRRAAHVKEKLVSLGIRAARLDLRSVGPGEDAGSESSDSAMRSARRVEIQVLKPVAER